YQDFHDYSRHLRIQIDILPRSLVAFDDTVRINAFCIGIRCRVKNRRLRLWPGKIGGCQTGNNATCGNRNHDLVSQWPVPFSMPTILPSSIFMILSAYSKMRLSWVTIKIQRVSLSMLVFTKSMMRGPVSPSSAA